MEVPLEQAYRIYICNLSYLGAGHAVVSRDVCRLLGDFLAANAERSCGLILMPNVCAKGAEWATAESVKGAVRAIEDLLADDAFCLAVRYFVLQFNENEMYTDKRALSVHGAMLVNSARRQVTAGSAVTTELVSVFRRSRLWAVQAVPGLVPVHPRSAFVMPASTVALELGAGHGKRLSDAAEFKQHISGPAMWSAVRCSEAH